ncbi:MAG: hypothetical protein ACYDC7_06130 [Acidithiobacillus ferrivorans]
MAAMLSVVAFSLFGQGGASPDTNVQAKAIAGTIEEQFLAAPFSKSIKYGCNTKGMTMPPTFSASSIIYTTPALSVSNKNIVSCVVSVYHNGNIATTLGAYKTNYHVTAP